MSLISLGTMYGVVQVFMETDSLSLRARTEGESVVIDDPHGIL